MVRSEALPGVVFHGGKTNVCHLFDITSKAATLYCQLYLAVVICNHNLVEDLRFHAISSHANDRGIRAVTNETFLPALTETM
jgi:hypothetical protein